MVGLENWIDCKRLGQGLFNVILILVYFHLTLCDDHSYDIDGYTRRHYQNQLGVAAEDLKPLQTANLERRQVQLKIVTIELNM